MLNYVISTLIFMVKGLWEYFHGKESLGFWKISKSESSKVYMNTHKVL
jgi:hypothetical protein